MWLELHRSGTEESIFVNMDRITSVCNAFGGENAILSYGVKASHISVKETPQEIMQMLGHSGEKVEKRWSL